MYSVMGLLSENGTIESGSILFDGQEISPVQFDGNAAAYEKLMEGIRGNSMSMIFQDPMSFLNPVLTIEKQLVEPLKNHKKMSKAELHQKAVELLTQVGIPSPEERLKQYPHQLSGGMRQRVIIAIALACNPKLIIADEPTTALDVTIQAKIIELIKELKEKTGSGVILITHDLGVVASACSRVYIMYGGKIVETGLADEIYYQPSTLYQRSAGLCEQPRRGYRAAAHSRFAAGPHQAAGWLSVCGPLRQGDEDLQDEDAARAEAERYPCGMTAGSPRSRHPERRESKWKKHRF